MRRKGHSSPSRSPTSHGAAAGLAVLVLVIAGIVTIFVLSSRAEQSRLEAEASEPSSFAEAQPYSSAPDPEVADNGPRQYTVDSFTTDQRINYLVGLRAVEPTFQQESDQVLLKLGAEDLC